MLAFSGDVACNAIARFSENDLIQPTADSNGRHARHYHLLALYILSRRRQAERTFLCHLPMMMPGDAYPATGKAQAILSNNTRVAIVIIDVERPLEL